MNKHVRIYIPATTANLGCGFDVFGMALSFYNEIEYFDDGSSKLTATFEGTQEDQLAFDGTNLMVQCLTEIATLLHQPLPGGRLIIHNRIPMARGLGSSSAAIVGAYYLAMLLFDMSLDKSQLLQWAVKKEGHPDNVAPAIFGNFTFSYFNNTWETVVYPVPDDWKMVVAWPNYKISTDKARQVLPIHVQHKEAVKTMQGATIFLSALIDQRPERLQISMSDYLHVPYRLPLIPHGDLVIKEALAHGAHAATISGSGSTMIAITDKTHSQDVAQAMCGAFGQEYQPQSRILSSCTLGVHHIELT